MLALARIGLLLALLAPMPACAASLYDGRGPRPGPDVLYAPPASAPQLENTGVWKAEPILVSGTSAYRDGEFLYQDYLYDDRGAGDAYGYPADPRYAGNAADLVELRLKPLEGETAIRLTYNTMLEPALVATTIALGSTPAPAPMPHGANAQMPAKVFVTVHGDSADAVDALTGVPIADSLATVVDLPRRQVEVRVPFSLFDPRDQRAVRVGAATGLWDTATGAYLPQAGGPAFFNVAFRYAEPPSPWRTSAQAAALAEGNLSPLATTVDFTKLAAGVRDDGAVPTVGFMDRILVSASEERQGRGDAISRRPGCEVPCALQYSGRLQPYAVYVPSRPPPPGGYGLTLDLHGCGQTHNAGFGTARQRALGDRGSGSIVLSPEARGDCYWYFGQAAADVFEAWADVARRYPLDAELTAIAGTSMGGYGAYKLAASYPDLFARAAVVAPCPGAGIQWTGTRGVPGGHARSVAPLLPALRNVPVMSWQATDDRTCLYARQAALVGRLDRLGYRYASWTFSGADHNALATAVLSNSQPLADFLGSARVDRDPGRVTYVVSPGMQEPARGLEADHAYWLSDVVARDAGVAGTIDVRSSGFGRRDPGPPPATHGDGVLPPGGLAYVTRSRLDGDPRPIPARQRLAIRARGISAVTIDARRARTGCSPALDVHADDLLRVRLDGCNVTYAIKRVCHATPVYDVLVRAPPGERPRSLGVTLRGHRVRVRHGKVRIDVRRHPSALAHVRVVSLDPDGRLRVRSTTHRWCPGR